ncbi:MAG: MarR family transcriptional regulator [Bacteroidetes bacterium]|nr:MAG: MarR family transcriptional regulator [Bacteroidota bacterium]
MEHANKNVGALLDRTLRLIKQRYILTFREAQVDLTPEQWVIIDQLVEHEGLSQTELANGSFKNAPTVSRIIDLLQKKGLLERRPAPNDGRQRQIYLTAAGRALHAELQPRVLQLREMGWQQLSEEDFITLQRILNQVFTNFSEREQEQRPEW